MAVDAIDPALAGPPHGRGSMGSAFWCFRAPPGRDAPGMIAAWAKALGLDEPGSPARRVFVDPVNGLIAMMSPSSVHDIHAEGVSDLVKAVADVGGRRRASLRSTTWKDQDPDGGERRGEADACFYFDGKADGYFAALAVSDAEAEAWADANPPDLVVEVEHTHGDPGKPDFYRDLGVPEMWRLDAGPDGLLRVEFLGLQAPEGPEPMAGSAILPVCTEAFVLEGMTMVREGVSFSAFQDLVRRALEPSGGYEP